MRLITSVLTALLVQSCCASFHFTEQTPLHDNTMDSVSEQSLNKIISSSPLLTLHKSLCEVESVTGDERDIGKLVVSFLESHNFNVTTQVLPPSEDYSKERFNVYAVPDAKKHGKDYKGDKQPLPKVLLTAHIDTVPPHILYSVSASKDGSRKDVFIAGRGTVDDKACVAVQIQTVLDLIANSDSGVSPSDLALLFVIGEETTGDGMGHFSESDLYKETGSEYKAILFGEPTELKLVSGHKGILMVHINAYGKAVHSGYPWLGRSANSMILPALAVLDKLGDIPEKEGGLPRNDKYGKTTVNVGWMQGGVAANVVPEHAKADITLRLAGGTLEEVRKLISNAIKKVDPEGLLKVDFGQGYEPVDLDADVDGFEVITVNYGTDVPNLKTAKGVKRYLYGPGSILVAHGKDEGLTVGDMEESLEGYKKLVLHALQS